jgi:hypothetical protein
MQVSVLEQIMIVIILIKVTSKLGKSSGNQVHTLIYWVPALPSSLATDTPSEIVEMWLFGYHLR